MGIRRTGVHTLPPNPVYVEFPRSDGDRKTWPTETECVVDKGQVNYFRFVELDESLSILWRKTVGMKVAESLGLPAGKAYVLKDFPAEYQLFDHNKGPVGDPRHDAYLYGSTRVGRSKFRSANEFIPHAMWLAKNDPTAPCACKYCSGTKSQTDISVSFGLSKARQSSAISTPPPPRQPRTRPAPYPPPQPKPPHASVRRAPKPAKQPLSLPEIVQLTQPPQAPKPIQAPLPAPKQALAIDKSNDIHNALTSREVQRVRYFRKGELVWCVLDPPIHGSRNEEDSILFWPGLIDTVTTKPITTPRTDLPSADMDMDMDDSASQGKSPNAHITWTVKQHTAYSVKLLATAHTYHVSDDEILPYLAYAPSEGLLVSLRNELAEALSNDISRKLAVNAELMSDYNPQDTNVDGDQRFKNAVTPYTLAIQIASHIATFWSPTDEWECKFSAPDAPAATQPSNGNVPSLQDVINSAMSGNASTLPRPDTEANPSAGNRSSERISNAQNIAQLRYQGLWWGAERIWSDELVRLKLARCQFAPQGDKAVFPPAGPSKSTRQWNEAHGTATDDQMLGAGERGMFMRIEGLFVVEVPRPNGQPGSTKECRASGMLFELVDEDWEEPDALTLQDGTGKGKGRAQDETISGTSGSGTPDPSTQQPAQSGSASAEPSVLHANGTDTPTESAPDAVPLRKDLSSQLSRPILSTPFPLPDPPVGYKFHAILPPGHECVLSLSLISGRYYPGLFRHPLLTEMVKQAVETPFDEGGLMLNKHLWAMEGLLPGIHQSMDPEHWKDTRHRMFEDADRDARDLLRMEIESRTNPPHWEASASSAGGSVSAGRQGDIPMDDVQDDRPPVAGPSSISATA